MPPVSTIELAPAAGEWWQERNHWQRKVLRLLTLAARLTGSFPGLLAPRSGLRALIEGHHGWWIGLFLGRNISGAVGSDTCNKAADKDRADTAALRAIKNPEFAMPTGDGGEDKRQTAFRDANAVGTPREGFGNEL